MDKGRITGCRLVHASASTEEIVKRVKDYTQMVTDLNASYWAKNGFTHAAAPTASLEVGKRYFKVVVKDAVVGSYGRVHTFIDSETGDILKAATWRAPAKNGVRGNIWAADLGKSVINWHGAVYLR